MPSDYAAIRADKDRDPGPSIVRWGPMLLTNRYDDSTHFIYELLQNSEDALARRAGWSGDRTVEFQLRPDVFRVLHYGKPFDELDVRGICGIAESTKDITAIGRFGIGFKSVYAYTTRPEVHSGDEDFVIENFVWPTAAPLIKRSPEETIISLPMTVDPVKGCREIAKGLQQLGPRTLLFLREIAAIAWNVGEGPSGMYLREKPEILGSGIRRITVLGEETGKSDVAESWLICSREVRAAGGTVVGQVEIAFSISEGKGAAGWSIQPVANSALVVFFPTVVPTNLGFLIQGPYRTTPSRDNVPKNDPWNQRLVKETASLLVMALEWLRDNGHLGVSALRCLPLEQNRFPEGSMFAPLFETVRTKMRSDRLLPTSTGSHVSADAAKLADTEELRHLFDQRQLGALFGVPTELAWISGDISLNRAPDVREYLMQELGIVEVRVEMVLSRLNKSFLEAQRDEWILRFYEFLRGQEAIIRSGRLDKLPIIRLADGSHVTARTNGQPQAFLPVGTESGFPTVRRAVCSTKAARALLQALGLTEPDAVDDVVRNILPKYRGHEIAVSDQTYDADIRRMVSAFRTDSIGQREKLKAALRESTFVRVMDAGSGVAYFARPAQSYLATQRLKDLFQGIGKVLILDDSRPCLRGEDVRDLLDACGANRYLQLLKQQSRFTPLELADMRTRAGASKNTGNDEISDFTVRGLNELLDALPKLDATQASRRASLLWEALCDVEDRHGTGAFAGTYNWFYHTSQRCSFDAAFVWKLNCTAWVPDSNGKLQRPTFIVFETLGWKPNPFLVSKIVFKPPIMAMLAREAGIDMGLLDLLKKLGVTSEAEFRARLGIEDEPPAPTKEAPESKPTEQFEGAASGDTKASSGTSAETEESDDTGMDDVSGADADGGNENDKTSETYKSIPTGESKRSPNQTHAPASGRTPPAQGEGGRAFISYIATHADEDDQPDPDGLDQQARMDLEKKAIKLILSQDLRLKGTPAHNRGFDLFEPDGSNQPVRWVEVKAMTGQLTDRPVCLSRAQFDCAWVHGEAYWLYIVERAGDVDHARVLRIQDPAGRAKYFTFDRGWREIGEVHGANAETAAPDGASY